MNEASVRGMEGAGVTQVEDRDRAWPALDGLARELSLEVLIRGPLPRRDLAAKFGVSAATLTRTVAPLIERGVLIELEEPLAGGMGRPARLLDVPASTHLFVGIKLTGESLHGVLTDLRADIVAARTVDLDDLDPPRVAAAIGRLVAELDTGSDATAVGISF